MLFFLLSEHTWKLLITRYSDWIQHCREKAETFSLPGSDLCTPAWRQPLAVSQWGILKFVFAHHTANHQRAARRRLLHSNCRRVFCCCFLSLFFTGSVTCTGHCWIFSQEQQQCVQIHSVRWQRCQEESALETRYEETQAQPHQSFFHYQNIDHRRER